MQQKAGRLPGQVNLTSWTKRWRLTDRGDEFAAIVAHALRGEQFGQLRLGELKPVLTVHRLYLDGNGIGGPGCRLIAAVLADR